MPVNKVFKASVGKTLTLYDCRKINYLVWWTIKKINNVGKSMISLKVDDAQHNKRAFEEHDRVVHSLRQQLQKQQMQWTYVYKDQGKQLF